MTTSGDVTLSYTQSEIIQAAFLIAAVYGLNQSISGSSYAFAAGILNRSMKSFENSAQHIWKRTEATLFLQYNQSSYVLGSGSTDHAANIYNTTTVASVPTLAGFIPVASTSGINIGDTIGIVYNTNTIFWSTIVNFSSNPLSVVISPALPTLAVVAGAQVYTYTAATNVVQKPLDLIEVRRREVVSLVDTPMYESAWVDYQMLPDKLASVNNQGSTPITWTYNRQIANGTIYIWPVPSTQQFILPFTYYEPLQVFDAASDTADIPDEWYEFLIHNLALKLLGAYGKRGTPEYADLKQEVAEMKMEILKFDNEETYIEIKPDWTRMY